MSASRPSLPWLTGDLRFPDPALALQDPPGLLAAGGDLSPDRLRAAYRNGIFPWSMPHAPLLWWSPDPRCVFRPAQFEPPRSLRKCLRQSSWALSVDRAFGPVVAGCAAPRRDSDDTWITPDMVAAYQRLFALGDAHAIEVWQDQALVGGLYGVSVGRLFCAESMFSRVSNASKLALWALMTLARQWQLPLVDTQLDNPHLLSLGAERLPRRHYLITLAAVRDLPAPPWRQAEAQLAGAGFPVLSAS